MIATLRLSAAALLCAAQLTHAADAPHGVWKGTVGAKAITVCFHAADSANYYYDDHPDIIGLGPDQGQARWREGGGTGFWKLAAPVSGKLGGTWQHPKRDKTLPISLTYVDGDDDPEACARDSFFKALEQAPLKVEHSAIQRVDPSHSYRNLSYAGKQTIELFGPEPGLKAINDVLKPDKSQAQVTEYFERGREFLARVGVFATNEYFTEPVYWGRDFVTIRFHEWIAGTGRQGLTNTYRTWNTQTGRELDLWTWIKPGQGLERFPPALKRLLWKGVKVERECRRDYQGKGDFTPFIDPKGMRFAEEAWGEGCEATLSIPYEKLMPYLSPAGVIAVRTIMKGQ